MNCPSCRQGMIAEHFEGHQSRTVELDICYACLSIWFDGRESLQLTPGSTLRLFQCIHDKHPESQRPLGSNMVCPHCRAQLVETTDMQRNTRFKYMRCPQKHGRLTTFFQFLREKNFVRALTPAELADIRKRVTSVNCANCAAPVNIGADMICGYCQTPVSLLNPEAVRTELEALSRKERGRKAGEEYEQKAKAQTRNTQTPVPGTAFDLADLLLTILGR